MNTKYKMLMGNLSQISAGLTKLLASNKDKDFRFSTMCGTGPQFCMFIFWDEKEKENENNKT